MLARLGITPAGAGKTCRLPVAGITGWDHPRRCGENEDRITEESAKAGSPPQVRGKQGYTVQRTHQYRITPAGAGKTKKIL